MNDRPCQTSLFAYVPGWTTEEAGIAAGSAFVSTVLTAILIVSIIRTYFLLLMAIMIPQCFGVAFWLVGSLIGMLLSMSIKPVIRGMGWGVLVGSALTGVGYYIITLS